ncbi:MAG: sensor histidine kinase, partial [Blastocatellia bacterium]
APIRISAQHPVELVAGEMIVVTVEDEGPGIPPELREKVFDKFFRMQASDTTRPSRAGGLGMGLAIARGIINAHGGRIRIEQGAHGKGARFVLTLPIGDNEEP